MQNVFLSRVFSYSLVFPHKNMEVRALISHKRKHQPNRTVWKKCCWQNFCKTLFSYKGKWYYKSVKDKWLSDRNRKKKKVASCFGKATNTDGSRVAPWVPHCLSPSRAACVPLQPETVVQSIMQPCASPGARLWSALPRAACLQAGWLDRLSTYGLFLQRQVVGGFTVLHYRIWWPINEIL